MNANDKYFLIAFTVILIILLVMTSQYVHKLMFYDKCDHCGERSYELIKQDNGLSYCRECDYKWKKFYEDRK